MKDVDELIGRIQAQINMLRRAMTQAAVVAYTIDTDPRTRGRVARDFHREKRGLLRAREIINDWAAEYHGNGQPAAHVSASSPSSTEAGTT